MAYIVTNIDDNETVYVGGAALRPGQTTSVDVIDDSLRLLRDRGLLRFDTDRSQSKTGAVIRYTNGVATGLEDANGNYLGDLVLAKRSPLSGGGLPFQTCATPPAP